METKHFFVDTEFTSLQEPNELISIAVVCEDKKEYYAVNREWDEPEGRGEQISTNFVKEIVIPFLGMDRSKRKTFSEIAKEIEKFVGTAQPIFWADYPKYDQMMFLKIWEEAGLKFPQTWPPVFENLNELAGRCTTDVIIEAPPDFTSHNALDDAKILLQAWDEFLKQTWLDEQELFQKDI
jgi:DNA polymerase III epsilon subunit-like protein